MIARVPRPHGGDRPASLSSISQVRLYTDSELSSSARMCLTLQQSLHPEGSVHTPGPVRYDRCRERGERGLSSRVPKVTTTSTVAGPLRAELSKPCRTGHSVETHLSGIHCYSYLRASARADGTVHTVSRIRPPPSPSACKYNHVRSKAFPTALPTLPPMISVSPVS
jgi:hypothetical protein